MNELIKEIPKGKIVSNTSKIKGTSSAQQPNWTILRGITTSQINQALKTNNPYPTRAFFREENKNCLECNNLYQEKECKVCQIPVFFRIKERKDCQFHSNCSEECRYKKDNWIRPKIKAGSYLELQGFYSIPNNGSQRKSFTAYFYKLLNQEAKVEVKERNF